MPRILGTEEDHYLKHKGGTPGKLSAERVLLAYIKGRQGRRTKLGALTLGPYSTQDLYVAAWRLIKKRLIRRTSYGVYVTAV